MEVRYEETRRRSHRVLIDSAGHRFTTERCNLDDAVPRRQLTVTRSDKPPCKWCWVADLA